jgi:hypothetical protein
MVNIYLFLIFITLNIIQTWLMLTCKTLIKGAAIIGTIEAVEVPLTIYIMLTGEIVPILIIIGVEVIQWLSIVVFG